MTRTRKRWSKSIGERGHKVRLYEARPGGPIMRSTWINGKEDRRSLGHRDRELATRQAYELLQGVLANVQAIEDESLTLGMLQALYLASPQHAAKVPGNFLGRPARSGIGAFRCPALSGNRIRRRVA